MISDEQIQKLKAEHGDDLHLLEAQGYEIVVKAPGRAEWKRFRGERSDPGKAVDAFERLLRASCVFPDAAGLTAILDKRPALADFFGAQVTEIAGLAASAAGRKL